MNVTVLQLSKQKHIKGGSTKMKKKIIILTAITIISVSSFLVGMRVQNNINLNNSIPITDIADMTQDNNGYYQISIKDIQYTNDDSTNPSYAKIMKFAKQIVYTNVQ